MIKLVVLYGHPTDSAAFDKYYHETHIPIARNIPNVKRAELGRIHSAMPGETPPYYWQAEFWFESPESLQEALTSEAGRATAQDIRNFATGGITMFVAEA